MKLFRFCNGKIVKRIMDFHWIQKDRWLDAGRNTRVQEVPSSGQPGVHVFIAESDERKAYETRLRERSMARAETHLKKVAAAVVKRRLKNPDQIGARAAGRITGASFDRS